MRVLLDTHVLLWGQAGDPALPKEAEKAIRSEGNEAWVSVVSFWEIGLKHSIGKLPLLMPLDAFFQTIFDAHFMVLPLDPGLIMTTMLSNAKSRLCDRGRGTRPTDAGAGSEVLMEATKYCSLG
jgi:PIN domain nuclease of toxin-antitoxin system